VKSPTSNCQVKCDFAYRKLKTKPKTSAELKEAFQVIWDNLPQGLINKTVKDFSNKTTGGWCCNLELAVNTSNIHSNNGILAFNHYLTVLFNDVIKLCCSQNIFEC